MNTNQHIEQPEKTQPVPTSQTPGPGRENEKTGREENEEKNLERDEESELETDEETDRETKDGNRTDRTPQPSSDSRNTRTE